MASLQLRSIWRSLLPILSLTAACGGGGGDDVEPPSGEHFFYVADTVQVPTNNTEAATIGLHVAGDGNDVQNSLGMVLATLTSMGFDIQGTIDETIAEGGIILLYDIQTPDFVASKGSGFKVDLGVAPSPEPCTDPADPSTCGQHLTGNGQFDIDDSSPDNAPLEGRIAGGTFTAGPGDLTLQIALGGGPISLDLIGAKIKATGVSDTGVEQVILGGAVSEEVLQTKVIPSIQEQLVPLLLDSCGPEAGRVAPLCGCNTSTGQTVIRIFDKTPAGNGDCKISVEELQNNQLIQSLLSPDVTINGVAALSIGISTTAVKATIR
jgi:hypothetical protein